MSQITFQCLRTELSKPAEEQQEFIMALLSHLHAAKDAAVGVEQQLADPNLTPEEKQQHQTLKKDLEEAANNFIAMEMESNALISVLREMNRVNEVVADSTVDVIAKKVKETAQVPRTNAEWQKNTKFVDFSRAVWKVRNPNKPLPWEDEEDVMVASEQSRSMACPLTGGMMEEPYKNTACGHSYEKSAIYQFVGQGTKACPQAGCSKFVSKQTLIRDTELEIQIKEHKKKEELEKKKKQAGTMDLDEDEDVVFAQ